MKCIKAIKSQKTAEIGDMARINDVDAEIRVRTGYWKYIPKSEWKNKNNESSETQNTKIDSEVKKMKITEKNRNFVKEVVNPKKKKN